MCARARAELSGELPIPMPCVVSGARALGRIRHVSGARALGRIRHGLAVAACHEEFSSSSMSPGHPAAPAASSKVRYSSLRQSSV